MRTARADAARRVAWLVALWALSSGCVYYNGIYNARAAARRGDLRLRDEAEGDASTQFQLSAAKAESVLVRHPTSTWRPHALYLAGRGAAFSGQCERAVQQLRAYLREAVGADAEADRARARVAMGACELQLNRVADARQRLDSLVAVPDAETARLARRWAARAALAAGDRDAAAQYLGAAGSSVLQWELLSASLAAAEYARAESLLVARADADEYRDDVAAAIRQLWNNGHSAGAARVVARYDGARLRDAQRMTLHYTLGDLQLRAGQDSAARRHLEMARALAGRDTATAHEAAARLVLMHVGRVTSVQELDSALSVPDSAVRRSLYGLRYEEQSLLFRLLLRQREPNGASLFLAAEVARDSLRAPSLATSLFVQLTRDHPVSPLAPRALYAASLLHLDSAVEWKGRVLSDYRTSSVARWLRAEDPATSADFISGAELLRFTWDETVRAWSDSVRRLRLRTRAGADAFRE